MDCQTQCQAQGFAQCSANLQGGCQIDCKGDGALFCDGQYVDQGGHAQACIDALNAYLKEHVQVSGSASGNCTNGVCSGQAQGNAKVTCQFAPPLGDSSAEALAVIGAAIGLGAARRRSRRG
jgi:hypothetical protein